MMAQHRRGWTPRWNERNSRSYSLSEAQVQACMDQPAPGQDAGPQQTAAPQCADRLVFSPCASLAHVGARVRLVLYAGLQAWSILPENADRRMTEDN